MSALSELVAGTFGLANTALSNSLAAKREGEARAENYRYGEMSADSADKRTRALYSDLYSPEAQMSQIKSAGLSPSMMYADGGGISGQAGAQGTGAAGISPTVFGLDPMMFADLQLKAAQTENIKANTEKTNEETEGTKLRNELQSMQNSLYGVDFKLMTSEIEINGQSTSLYELAGECSSYENFQKRVYDASLSSGDNELINGIKSEQGQRTLREIFKTRDSFARDIAVLSEDTINAQFQRDIIAKLKSSEYAELNAQSQVQALKTDIATMELTESQKDAWNDLLNKLEEKSPTAAKIAVVLAMVVDRFAGKLNISAGSKHTDVNHIFNRK